MDDVLAVRRSKAFGYRGADVGGALPVHAAGGSVLAQVPSLEQLRHLVGDLAVTSEIVDVQDVRVGEVGDGLGFALESGETVRTL